MGNMWLLIVYFQVRVEISFTYKEKLCHVTLDVIEKRKRRKEKRQEMARHVK